MHGKKYYRSQNSLGIITVHKSLGRKLMLMKIKMFQVSVLDEVLRKGNF